MWGSLGRGSSVQRAGAPQRRELPGMKWRVSTSQAEAAPAVGQHESSGGCARRNGGSARVGRRPRPPWVSTSGAEAAPAVGQHEWGGGCARRGSARVKRRPRPPWVSTSGAEAAPAVTVGRRRSSEWFPPILPKRQRHGKGLRCFHAKTAPGGSLPRGWCGDFVSGYRICRYSFPAP